MSFASRWGVRRMSRGKGIIAKGASTFIDILAQYTRVLVVWIFSADTFDMLVGLIILGNCLTLGFEAKVFIGNVPESGHWLRIADDVFTVFFTVELFLRLYLYGWRDFLFGRDRSSNMFDAGLVLMTDTLWVFSALATDVVTAESLCRSFTVCRAVRLMRLVRVVQKVPFFREVWLLLRGLTQSFRVLFWTILVIAAVTYVFAIFGVLLVSVDVKKGIAGTKPVDSLTQEQLEMLWESTGGVGPWMYTLIQVLTLDSWNSIMRPLMLVAPWSWVLFYVYIAIAVIVLLNLVTAIIVENAFKTSHMEEEELANSKANKRLESIQNLQRLFSSLDDDGSGGISWDEFEAGFGKPEIRQQLEMLEIHEDQLMPLFDLLDVGGGGVLTLEEFFEGIQRMTGAATAKETFRISKRIEHICKLVETSNQIIEQIMKVGSDENNVRKGYFRSPAMSSSSQSSRSRRFITPERDRETKKFTSSDSEREPKNLTQSCLCHHSEERDFPRLGVSLVEDDIRKILDNLARKIDAMPDWFRSQGKDMHCHVGKGSHYPESITSGPSARMVKANGFTSRKHSVSFDEEVLVQRVGESGDIQIQADTPLTSQLGSTRGFREPPTQPRTEYSEQRESISKEEAIGPASPRHTLSQKPSQIDHVPEELPEAIVPEERMSPNEAAPHETWL